MMILLPSAMTTSEVSVPFGSELFSDFSFFPHDDAPARHNRAVRNDIILLYFIFFSCNTKKPQVQPLLREAGESGKTKAFPLMLLIFVNFVIVFKKDKINGHIAV